VYEEEAQTFFIDEERGYQIQWLVPESNEKEMEPIRLTLQEKGEFKQFEPSLSETFGYVLSGRVIVKLGTHTYFVKAGESIYFHASDEHQIINDFEGPSELLLVVTESYL
jgi:mannose-6-phosphate isomerase-like protein (cupin superfamily)